MHGAGGLSYNREPTLKDDFPILATLDRVRDPQLWIGLRNRALSYVYRVDGDVRRRGGYTHEAWRIAKQAINLRNGLILLWAFTLLWGERTIFRESLESCAWGGWEKWVSGFSVDYYGAVYLGGKKLILRDGVSSLKTPRRIMSLSSPIPSW